MLSRLLFLVISCCVLSCSSPPEGELEFIIYNVWEDQENDVYDIYRMEMDGSNPVNLSNSKSVDWAYHISNKKIYFLSDRDTAFRNLFLYTMDIDGQNVNKIFDLKLEDSWLDTRKKGQEIVVTTKSDSTKHFVVINNLKGEILDTLHSENKWEINDPCFIGESRIAFRSKEYEIDEIWTLDLKTNERNQISQYPMLDTTSGYFYYAGPPKWINDKVSYISKQRNNHSIYGAAIDDYKITQFTSDTFNQGFHDWSADLNTMIYDGYPIGEAIDYEIYSHDLKNDVITKLTEGPKEKYAPLFFK